MIRPATPGRPPAGWCARAKVIRRPCYPPARYWLRGVSASAYLAFIPLPSFTILPATPGRRPVLSQQRVGSTRLLCYPAAKYCSPGVSANLTYFLPLNCTIRRNLHGNRRPASPARIHSLAHQPGLLHSNLPDIRRRNLKEVTVDHDEVRPLAGLERAQALFLMFGVSRIQCAGS